MKSMIGRLLSIASMITTIFGIPGGQRAALVGMAALIAGWLCVPVKPAAAQIPPPLTDRPGHRLRDALRATDNQLAALLVKVPPLTSTSFSVDDLRISYWVVIRHLYKEALQARRPALKAVLALRADELAAGAPRYGALVKKIFAASAAGAAPPSATIITAYAALHRFENLGKAINAPINSERALHHYVTKVLTPLMPLVALDLAGKPTPQVWPMPPPRAGEPVTQPAEMPITQALVTIQQANIMPTLRSVLLQIVSQLQTGTPPHVISQDRRYYHLMLAALTLAEDIQSSPTLGLETQGKLNHQLLLGLLLFKDPRTRSDAVRRLTRLNFIATSLNLLEASELPPKTKLVVGQCLHGAIRLLSHRRSERSGARQIETLQQMIRSYEAYAQESRQKPATPQKAAWSLCLKTAAGTLSDMTVMLSDGYSHSAVTHASSTFAVIRVNLDRLLAMPQVEQDLMVYHPIPTDGVKRNIVRWTRQIGGSPDVLTTGARHFDQMQEALQLLARVRLAMPHRVSTTMSNRLSGGRYSQYVQLFLNTQRQLINALASRHVHTGSYMAHLQHQWLVFRCTGELASLQAHSKPLAHLNAWGAWYISSTTRSLLGRELLEALESEYLAATGKNVRGENWLNFRQAAPAIHALATACRHLNPLLPRDAGAFSTLFLKAATFPSGAAQFVRAVPDFQLACLALNAAGYDESLGRTTVARQQLGQAIARLDHATMP